MNITELISFCEVAHHQSFTKAAKELHLAQHTVSQHVKSLEEEFGVSLFERHGSPFRITSAGTTFLRLTKPIVQGVGNVKSGMEHPGRYGSIVVGANPDMMMHHLPKVIRRFQDQYPDVRIWLRAHPYQQLLQLVRSGELDLALCSPPPSNDPTLKYLELFQDKTVLMTPMGHPLLDQQSVELQDIANWPLIMTGSESWIRPVIDRAMRIQGVNCEVVLVLDDTESIKRYVEIGLGVSICSDYNLRPEDHDRLGVVILDHIFQSSPVGVCTLYGKYRGPALQNFIEVYQALLSEPHSPDVRVMGATKRGATTAGAVLRD